MDYFVSSAAPARTRTGCAIAGVYEGGRLGATARLLDKACGRRIGAAVRGGDLGGKLGETLLLSRLPGLRCERVLLVGLGAAKDLDAKRYRRALTEATALLRRIGARDAISYLGLETVRGADARQVARHTVEAAEHALYRFTAMKSRTDPAPALERFGVAADRATQSSVEAGIREGSAVAGGVRLTRELGNLPANVCTPTYLAKAARDLAKRHRRIRVEVLGAQEMKKLGMNAFLAVAQASAEPPKLIVLQYRAGPRGGAPVALV